MSASAGPHRPALEVADVIRGHGAAFLAQYGGTLTAAQRRALRELALCRTAALGGHVQRCLESGTFKDLIECPGSPLDVVLTKD
jgi:hypothetical protein